MLPIADFFMAVMWSRPHGLSLEESWVTPATIVLGLVVAVAGMVGGVAALAYAAGHTWIWFAAGLVMIVVAAGSGVVAAYGIRQRLLDR
jgi:hypothetical protein